jgi:hypothetical protein
VLHEPIDGDRGALLEARRLVLLEVGFIPVQRLRGRAGGRGFPLRPTKGY